VFTVWGIWAFNTASPWVWVKVLVKCFDGGGDIILPLLQEIFLFVCVDCFSEEAFESEVCDFEGNKVGSI
jgi:hypothetical protein